MAQREPVSLIMTVFNERKSVERFFTALSGFTRLPDEVVIVDGGSTDDTVDVIKAHIPGAPVPVRLIEERECNISQGRNIAIRGARHDLIAITDMGCRIPEEWLERILAPFEDDPAVEVVGGYYGHHCETPLQHCFARMMYRRTLDTKHFLPSSRSFALRRHVWEAVGGYPEHLVVAEDSHFVLEIRKRGFKEALAPEAKVYWEVARTYSAVYRKFFRYARSSGAVLMRPAVYGFYIGAFALCIVWLVLALVASPWFFLVLLAHVAGYSYFRVFRRPPVRQNLSPGDVGRYFALMAVVDGATVLGYLAGLWLFARGKQEVWTPPPPT